MKIEKKIGYVRPGRNVNGEKLVKKIKSAKRNIRDEIVAISDDDELLFLTEPEFDDAIIGVGRRCGASSVVAYDADKVMKILQENDGMTEDESIEYFEYNIAGAYVGEKTPIFIWMVRGKGK